MAAAMKKIKEMNCHEKMAYQIVKSTFNYSVGGWYNDILDGLDEEENNNIPKSLDEAKELIYNWSVAESPKEMRFATSDFIKSCINHLFKKDEDVKEIAQVMNW